MMKSLNPFMNPSSLVVAPVVAARDRVVNAPARAVVRGHYRAINTS
jgi:hypothetical protein